MPAMMSRTSVWAPKPNATPRMPAPANSGPTSQPSTASEWMMTAPATSVVHRWRRICPSVRARWRARASSAPARATHDSSRATSRNSSRWTRKPATMVIPMRTALSGSTGTSRTPSCVVDFSTVTLPPAIWTVERPRL